MRKIAIITALLLTTTGARAQYVAFGVGTSSCATWLSSTASENRGGAYITGMWTGLNAANPGKGDVGDSTDGFGIIGEVKKFCGQQPSMTLSDAILRVYVMMERREHPTGK